MAILYIASDKIELESFAGLLEMPRGLKWPLNYASEGILSGKRILLAANGAGENLSARVLESAIRANSMAELSSSALEAVVSTGFCGALSPELGEGSIVIADKIVTESGETFACSIPKNAEAAVGPVYSTDRVITTAEEKSRLFASTNALAVDMESAALVRRAQKENIPFFCVRAVSDRADESLFMDMNAVRSGDGRISRGKIVTYALVRPALWPKLFQLRNRARHAAAQLGDFLVRCRIEPPTAVTTEPEART